MAGARKAHVQSEAAGERVSNALLFVITDWGGDWQLARHIVGPREMLVEQMHLFPLCLQEMQWSPDFWEQVKLFQGFPAGLRGQMAEAPG